MCGRYTFTDPRQAIALFAQLCDLPANLTPRFNAAPTQDMSVVLWEAGRPGPEMRMLRWGLIPHWAHDPAIGHRLINARCETLHSKNAFRDSFARRRCLIPSDGFYEWQRRGRSKVPHHIRMKDGAPLAYAGLWDRWQSPDGQAVETFTIITTAANDVVAPLHDRMPLIMPPRNYRAWLDPQLTDVEQIRTLLVPADENQMEAVAVSSLVNSPKNETPQCLTPAPSGTHPPEQAELF